MVNERIDPDAVRCETAARNLEHAINQLRHQGYDPVNVNCIVDLAAGEGFESITINKFPTILASRAAGRSYYATMLKRRVTLRELMRLQGVDPTRVNIDGVPTTAVGHIIGNAMSCNVVKAICQSCLACACLV